jgi:hypothetical protein
VRWDPGTLTLELTERNVCALIDKLDDPLSKRTITSPCRRIAVTAVESAGAAEAATAPGTLPLTRSQLETLATVGAEVRVAGVRVVSLPDAEHYTDRPAGEIYMPTSGEYR